MPGSPLPDGGTVVVYDLEWTSWPGFQQSGWRLPGCHREIVQIGAVALDAGDGLTERAAFDALVRPARNPELSPYFVELTGIDQERVDREGRALPDALADFVAFIGEAALLSHGEDHLVVAENCALHGLALPAAFGRAADVRAPLAAELGLAVGAVHAGALAERYGLVAPGRAHDALDDARGVAAVLRHLRDAGRL